MIKHIENAAARYIGSDVRIQYEDETWEFAEKHIHGSSIILAPKLKVRGFRRHKLSKVNISAHFTLMLSIGNEAAIIYDKGLRDIIFPFDDSGVPLDEQIEDKAYDLYEKELLEKSKEDPICFTTSMFARGYDVNYWFFNGKFYKDLENLDGDAVKALLVTRQRMRKARINRAKTIANSPKIHSSQNRRGFIPEDTRLLVWERDGGKCAKCGATNELQFDHIIPFSLGGSSTSDNLQILCGPCNRTKSNSIA